MSVAAGRRPLRCHTSAPSAPEDMEARDLTPSKGHSAPMTRFTLL